MWKGFVKEQANQGGGRLFKYIANEDKAFLNVTIDRLGGKDKSPEHFLKLQADQWRKLWQPEGYDRLKVQRALKRIREEAIISPMPTIATSELKASIDTYKKDSKGIDCWTATELKALPMIAIEQFTAVFNLGLEIVAVPHQHLLSLHPCLGKPNNGVRTICKTPMLYRMQSRATFHSVIKWELDNLQSYDSASRGSSALLAALHRSLLSEVAEYSGEETVAAFNDYDKFFDNVDIEILVDKLIDNGYPLTEAAISLQQHVSPRNIQCQGFSSLPINISRSIIVWDNHSVAVTRN